MDENCTIVHSDSWGRGEIINLKKNWAQNNKIKELEGYFKVKTDHFFMV